MVLPLVALTTLNFVTANILTKAIGATVAFFVIVGFIVGFALARVIYHRR